MQKILFHDFYLAASSIFLPHFSFQSFVHKKKLIRTQENMQINLKKIFLAENLLIKKVKILLNIFISFK